MLPTFRHFFIRIYSEPGPPDPAVLINRPPLPPPRLSVLEMQNSLEDDLIKKHTQVSLAVEVRLPAVIIIKEVRCCHFKLIFRRLHLSVHVLPLEVK